jgi:hypothetical protein
MVIYKHCTNEMGDILTLTLKIEEDIKFQKGIIVKLKPGKFPVWKLSGLALFGPLKQIISDLHNFFRIAHWYNKSWGTNSLL